MKYFDLNIIRCKNLSRVLITGLDMKKNYFLNPVSEILWINRRSLRRTSAHYYFYNIGPTLSKNMFVQNRNVKTILLSQTS